MTANYVALALFIGSWIAQFVGHGKFEGRKPALLDNIFQAFFLAPLFVWLEILFMLGYRPDLQQRVEKLVAADIAKFREEQKKEAKANGNGNGNAVNGHAKAS
jgi:2-hydroxy fatty acid dioxygenase